MSKNARPIHLLLLLPHLDGGGGQRRVKVYCELLNRGKYSLSVCVTSEHLVKQLSHIVGENTPTLISSNPGKILAFAQSQEVDVVYTFYDGKYNEQLFQLLTEMKSLGMKLLANNVFAYYDKRMDELFDHVFFQTNMMLGMKFRSNHPTHRISFQKYSVLPNPVHAAYFEMYALTPAKRQKIRSQLGLGQGDVVVARFGRSDIVKWGDILTSVIWMLRGEPHIKFLIVGIPTSRKYLLEFASYFFPHIRRTVVIKQPTTDDRQLMHWMQCADIIGHGVKIGEGCSNAINEAMFWGKPVITNSTPFCDNGQVEQVDDGKTGIIANTPSAWVEAIRLLTVNPQLRYQMGKAGHTKTITQYGAASVTRELEAVIASVMKGKVNKSVLDKRRKEVSEFTRWYTHWEKNNLPTPSTTQQLFSIAKRCADYLEYRVS